MSSDGFSCMNLDERYYVTYDGLNVTFDDMAY